VVVLGVVGVHRSFGDLVLSRSRCCSFVYLNALTSVQENRGDLCAEERGINWICLYGYVGFKNKRVEISLYFADHPRNKGMCMHGTLETCLPILDM